MEGADAIEAARAAGVSWHLDREIRSAAERDFGGLFAGECLLVAEPASIESSARFIGELAARGVGCTLRGKGYSQSGQSVPAGTVSLCTRRLDRIGPVDVEGGTISVEAGATLRQIVTALREHDLGPPVLPLNLDMTVGGLLSAGGIGPTSHRRGPVIANVASLDVITADGVLRRCSRTEDRPLFDAVRGGVGRAGLIARATLELSPAPRRVEVTSYLYDDVSRWLRDQRLASSADPRLHIEAFAWGAAKVPRAVPGGSRPFTHWMFGLTLGAGDDVPEGVARDLRASLRPARAFDGYAVDGALFPERYEPRFSAMVREGLWGQPHPWIESIVPFEGCESVVMRFLEALPPAVGDGHRFTILDTRNCPSHFGAVPEGLCLVMGVLPVAVPRGVLTETLPALEHLNTVTREARGRRYLSGWLGSSPADYLSAHAHARTDETKSDTLREVKVASVFRSRAFPG